jgi:hypothetical protein
LRTPLVDRIPFAKIVCLLAAVFIASLVLGGVTATTTSAMWGGPLSFLIQGSAILMMGSSMGLGAAIPLWIVLAFLASPGRVETQRLFYDRDVQNKRGGNQSDKE